ncbi:MAG: HNH endonuclease [Candidatus Acidiferrum sp.]|jgi:HNH endonuclease
MRFYVGITDDEWFANLAGSGSLDEANFWQPSGGRQFRVLQSGEPFLFKLHSPKNYIVGGGFFSHFTILPVSFAWSTFTTKNGALNEREMRLRIARYRRVQPSPFDDYEIGCILLQSPFFFPEDEWIPASDWAPNIVQGRSYETADGVGASIWQQVEDRLMFHRPSLAPTLETANEEPRFGTPQIILPRLGQGSFRVIVTDAYKRRCAFTTSPILHVLEAAHIRPYGENGPHAVTNGILFRQDVHTLFDRGYITVTPEYRFEVSRCIKDEFDNGHEYYSAHGKPITLPEATDLHPNKDFLIWHNQNVFLG